MEKIKHIPLILFTILTTKLVVMPASVSDALVLAIIGGLTAFYEFKIQNKQSDETRLILEKQSETILALAKELAELRSAMSAVKVAQGMRNPNVRGL
jgi:hypothetical protein